MRASSGTRTPAQAVRPALDWLGHAVRSAGPVVLPCALALSLVAPCHLPAQQAPDRVLVRTLDVGPGGALPVDRGLSGVWQRLQKLRTTASVLYTAGHPDDEEAGVLTLLGRGMGVRTALLTLNRGEGGANAIGPELFDALGLIRTEELRLAGRYYGLDDQYFTTAVDYGYSKTLDEAMRSWDRDAVLGDMVRVIRINRPTVVISRWHGSERDGHGHHQASGVLTAEAVLAAADPERFPLQITQEGLRPWRVRRLYRGRLLGGEPYDAALNPHAFDPWLGESYQALGMYGLSLQRSQTSGRIRPARPPLRPVRYELLAGPTIEGSTARGGQRNAGANRGADGPTAPTPSVFDGLETSLTGVGELVGETLPPGALQSLETATAAVEEAIASFGPAGADQLTAHVARALAALRSARAAVDPGSEADFVLAVKERQAADALAASASLRVRAIATPPGAGGGAPMGPAVPGQTVDVHVELSAHEDVETRLLSMDIVSRAGWSGATWAGRPESVGRFLTYTLAARLPTDAEPTAPWFHRSDIRQNRYAVRDSAELHLGESRPEAEILATLDIAGQRVEIREPIRRIETNAPQGVLLRPLDVAPVVSVSAAPRIALAGEDGGFGVRVTVTSNSPAGVGATVGLDLPTGWRSDPDVAELTFGVAGQTESVGFHVDAAEGAASADTHFIDVRVRVGDRAYGEGYQVIEHPDLGSQRLWAPARVAAPPIRARVSPGLRVGYVMGVGDEVPEAIRQLGATVSLLAAQELEGGDLDAYDAIVIGTRAYAVRPDLAASNPRLMNFARAGGHLVVLYQTPEYDPTTQAPFPATLPPNAEEVSEEDAPVRILDPDHTLLRDPYPISVDDFDGWIEQRGSKFFSTWDPAYTPLVETHDQGQRPQEGVWLTAPLGEGRFTYIALALHRQLPYGVPGAYRILANLLVAQR